MHRKRLNPGRSIREGDRLTAHLTYDRRVLIGKRFIVRNRGGTLCGVPVVGIDIDGVTWLYPRRAFGR